VTRAVPRTTSVPKERATVYLRRGENLLLLVEGAEASKNWDGVATVGVQAAIALADAYTIAKLGLRSRGQEHQEVVPLISGVGTKAASELAAQIQTVLNRKNEVEYGDREVSANDARRIAHVVRKIGVLVSSELS